MTVSSSDGERLAARAPLAFATRPAGPVPRFVVDETAPLQTIDGFGASFLEAGMVVLSTLPDRAAQDAVLRAIFDPVAGAGFSLMKTVLGGTDFQSQHPEWFTYDDTPGDADMSSFTIARDLEPDGLIPYIRRAHEAGGDFLLQAPMDYPPDWMLVDLDDDQNVAQRWYPALARYYLRYVQAYEAQGVHIDYLSLFNEPGVYTKIPYDDINVILRDHVGPLFAAAGVTTKLQPCEPNTRRHAAEGLPAILDDPETRRHVALVGYHGYDQLDGDPDPGSFQALADLRAHYPDLHFWMTEVCCMVDHTRHAFEDGDFWGRMLLDDLEAGANGWIWWNLILDEGGGPWLVSEVHWDPPENRQPSVVTIDRTTHQVIYNGIYYYLAHFSRYVRPGAVRIATTPRAAGGVRAISFRNAAGGYVTNLLNSSGAAVDVEVEHHGEWVRVRLPGIAIVSLRW